MRWPKAGFVLLLLAFATKASALEYEPGNLEGVDQDMYLSKGLSAKIIARSGEPVAYFDGTSSTENFHSDPDGAAVFEDESEANLGGWVYVSNSEADFGNGGVGAIKFDPNGNVIDYKMVLTGTSRNCNGGKTDWQSWISCEEDLFGQGKIYQVDPFGEKDPVMIALGNQGGVWEAFAHDTRDPEVLYAFITEDTEDGAVQRMTYQNPNYTYAWDILIESAPLDYLYLEPANDSSGTFKWIPDEAEARANAESYYPSTEGMKMDGNILRVVSKGLEGFFELDLDEGNYTFEVPDFDGQPDQSTTVVQDDGSKLIYFTEEAHPFWGFFGSQVGLYTRDEAGEYTTILFGDDYSPETTGVAFSPDGLHMYFAYQTDGYLFDVTRTDGLSFFSPATPAEVTDDGGDESILDWIGGLLFPAAEGQDLP
ncbi:osmC-like protein [Seminavis robusta]|uniref:OsmC-like protein n=1 Tax=Seminavis robusta TaxID=568900 RepID=A0A9N8F269_9STRA|nr:osmC-like protein [Seminavis robusta]|eukprot:Sro3622_g349790.1 osmC-like protein (424) ;mRNA; f:431-2040